MLQRLMWEERSSALDTPLEDSGDTTLGDQQGYPLFLSLAEETYGKQLPKSYQLLFLTL